MSIYSDILNYYQNNPLAEIDNENLPAYLIMVEKTLNDTLLEYSRYKPIYETKEITPTTDTIDIYIDISPLVIEVIYFQEKDKLHYDLMKLNNILGYNNIRNFDKSSLLSLVANYEYYQILKEYFTVHVERQIVGGKYITPVEPNVTYIAAYTRFRTQDELTLADKTNFEKLFVLNLIDNMQSNTKFMGETVLRSVSISGMSISFGFPSVEQTRKYIQEQKNNILKSISDNDGYLPEVF